MLSNFVGVNKLIINVVGNITALVVQPVVDCHIDHIIHIFHTVQSSYSLLRCWLKLNPLPLSCMNILWLPKHTLYQNTGKLSRPCTSKCPGVTYNGASINTLRQRHNGHHFTDDIFKCIFLNEIVWIQIKISLKFVPPGPINNIPALVQIIACRRPGDKPLSGPMMVRLPTHICITRPQWVNTGCLEHQLNSYAHTLAFYLNVEYKIHVLNARPSVESFLFHFCWPLSNMASLTTSWVADSVVSADLSAEDFSYFNAFKCFNLICNWNW